MSNKELLLQNYRRRTANSFEKAKAVLFDMDGILYDSMPGHCRAWKQMCDENGIEADANEFFAYEGRTGASTINILYLRQFGHEATEDDIKRLYGRKSELFKAMGLPALIPGAQECLRLVLDSEALPCLVTGSGQLSILERLEKDFPGAFPSGRRITAKDVVHGKPAPEPFLRGMERTGAQPFQSIAIDNAPLGVESASRSGALTIGVRTGPLPEGALLAAGADIELNSMIECAVLLAELL